MCGGRAAGVGLLARRGMLVHECAHTAAGYTYKQAIKGRRKKMPKSDEIDYVSFLNQVTLNHRTDPPRGRTWNLLIRSQTLCH